MMDTPLEIGLTLAVVGSIFAFMQTVLYGPKGLITQARMKEAKQLKLKIRMARGSSAIDNFTRLARIYRLLNRLSDAERTCRQAIALAESELGKEAPSLVPILEEYATILKRAKRIYEARAVRARAREITNSRLT